MDKHDPQIAQIFGDGMRKSEGPASILVTFSFCGNLRNLRIVCHLR
jgi:hypothetical protein